MSKLKVGIIGAGNIFQSAHVEGWITHPKVELIAISDTNEETVKKVAEKYGITRVYSDYKDMLDNEELDAVDICAPNIYHSEIAIAALDKGIHVFSEKPDAINPLEAQKMADAAKNAGKILMVMRNNRFTQASQFLKKYIENGKMGELYTGRAGWIRRRGIPGKGGWFTTKSLSGGGPLIDLGVHMIDLAIWLMGNPRPVAVTGAAYTKFANNSSNSDSPHSRFGEGVENGTFDVEDLATGFIRFDNGATLQVEFSWASNIEEEKKFLELRGTNAGFSLVDDQIKIMTEIEQVLCDITPRILKGPEKEGHYRNIHHFIGCILGDETPLYDPNAGVDMIKILSALYTSAETGVEVQLEEEPVVKL